MTVGSGNSGAGGQLVLSAGTTSFAANGGVLIIRSGFSSATNSGNMRLQTPNSGTAGVSGNIVMSTGRASAGNSGSLYLGTGTSLSGRGGPVYMTVGSGNCGQGGFLVFSAGMTTSPSSAPGGPFSSGGQISVVTGYSSVASSGNLLLQTANAGFEVVGVDIADHSENYPYHFVPMDAMQALDNKLEWLEHTTGGRFDAFHASPPCQAYTTMNNRHASSSPPLISETRELLRATGRPWVIENVTGALREMNATITLTGAMFGLDLHRPRLFEASFMLLGLPPAKQKLDAAAVYGKCDGRRLMTRKDGSELRVATLERGSAAMGIDWMTWDELREAIPPAYTEFIGTQLLAALSPQEGTDK